MDRAVPLLDEAISRDSIQSIFSSFIKLKKAVVYIKNHQFMDESGRYYQFLPMHDTLNSIISEFKQSIASSLQSHFPTIPVEDAISIDTVTALHNFTDTVSDNTMAISHWSSYVYYVYLVSCGHRHSAERNTKQTPITRRLSGDSKLKRAISRVTSFGYMVTLRPQLFRLNQAIYRYQEAETRFIFDALNQQEDRIRNQANCIQINYPYPFDYGVFKKLSSFLNE